MTVNSDSLTGLSGQDDLSSPRSDNLLAPLPLDPADTSIPSPSTNAAANLEQGVFQYSSTERTHSPTDSSVGLAEGVAQLQLEGQQLLSSINNILGSFNTFEASEPFIRNWFPLPPDDLSFLSRTSNNITARNHDPPVRVSSNHHCSWQRYRSFSSNGGASLRMVSENDHREVRRRKLLQIIESALDEIENTEDFLSLTALPNFNPDNNEQR